MPRRNVYEFLITAKDNASPAFNKVESSIGGVNSAVTKLAAATGGIFSIREIVQTANTYRLMQNRMRLVTADSRELAAVTKEVTRISAETRSSWESTANLYARVARSSRELGLSQRELLDFSQTVQQSIRISGSTAAEASAGVIQFGQALASSRLSGDELRSVLEQMPRLAQAIAEGMGVGIGTLRELGEQGELSAEAVLKALRDSAEEIAEEFGRLDPLISEAFEVLRGSAMVAIGEMDAMYGVSTLLARAILDVAKEVRNLSGALTFTLEPGKELSDTMQRIAIFAVVTSTALRQLISSLVSTLSFAATQLGEFIGSAAAHFKVLFTEGFGAAEASGIGEAFREQFGKEFTKAFGELNDDLSLQMIDMFESLAQVMGTGFTMFDDSVDLNKTTDKLNQLTRKQRDAMASAERNLLNMRDALLQQNSAFAQSAATGEEYNDALRRVRANTLAVKSANHELELQVLQLIETNIRLRQQREDRTAIEALNEELRIIKLTERARFVEARVAQLSTQATLKQIEAFRQAAAELFDEQQKLSAQADFMENIAEQAAKNILDAFADFLFDPFEEGVRGMLKSFLDALRRMLANALAFQVLSGIPGIKELLPTRAAGGPVGAGMPVLVGERGPELFIPTSPGTIRNNSATKASGGVAAGMQFVTNIDARGADPGLIARLPQILEDRDRRLMLAVQRYARTGLMPI